MTCGDDILCNCFGIPKATVEAVIRRSGTTSIAVVTERCTAGGGCGSCRPEVADLIREISGEEPIELFDHPAGYE